MLQRPFLKAERGQQSWVGTENDRLVSGFEHLLSVLSWMARTVAASEGTNVPSLPDQLPPSLRAELTAHLLWTFKSILQHSDQNYSL